jgi:hypothetical protein
MTAANGNYRSFWRNLGVGYMAFCNDAAQMIASIVRNSNNGLSITGNTFIDTLTCNSLTTASNTLSVTSLSMSLPGSSQLSVGAPIYDNSYSSFWRDLNGGFMAFYYGTVLKASIIINAAIDGLRITGATVIDALSCGSLTCTGNADISGSLTLASSVAFFTGSTQIASIIRNSGNNGLRITGSTVIDNLTTTSSTISTTSITLPTAESSQFSVGMPIQNADYRSFWKDFGVGYMAFYIGGGQIASIIRNAIGNGLRITGTTVIDALSCSSMTTNAITASGEVACGSLNSSGEVAGAYLTTSGPVICNSLIVSTDMWVKYASATSSNHPYMICGGDQVPHDYIDNSNTPWCFIIWTGYGTSGNWYPQLLNTAQLPIPVTGIWAIQFTLANSTNALAQIGINRNTIINQDFDNANTVAYQSSNNTQYTSCSAVIHCDSDDLVTPVIRLLNGSSGRITPANQCRFQVTLIQRMGQ